MSAVPPVATAPHVSLQCMEVWGGNRAADTAVAAPGLDAWLHARPYRGHQAGGDIHYISNCAAGIITRFAIADVSGHGDGASELGIILRNLMRRSINTPDQTRLARALNTSFAKLATTGRFATALLATYYAPTDHLIVCNAGHPRPLWFHAAANAWQILDDATPMRAEGAANLPLGVIDPTGYSQFAVPLDPGDVVVLYTDAVIEAADAHRRQLGEGGLLRIANAAPRRGARDLAEHILAAVNDHTAGAEPADDTTLLVIRHTGENPARHTVGDRLRVTARMLGLMHTTQATR
jgi:sigma-B regulation protein RsbU (phosphoserine phosphatase)